MSSHDIGDGAGTASAKASSGSASDLPPPSDRGENDPGHQFMYENDGTYRDAYDKGHASALLSAEAQITALKAERDEAQGSLARVNEWTRAELAAVHAEYSALLDQAREVVTDLVRFAGEVIGCQDAPNRGDWGVECPLCMGELVEQQDRDLTDAATLFLTRLSKTGGEGVDLQTNVEPQCADPQAGRASGAGVSGAGEEL